MRLLLVEDDSMIGAAAQQGLRHEGHSVDWVRDGHQGEAAVAGGSYDLVLLDLGLPRKDGLTILRGWRARGIKVPVLIVTARDAVSDRVAGLDAGADDYLVKPFDFRELLARLRAVMRRGNLPRAPDDFSVGDLHFETAGHRVVVHGEALPLTAREYALLLHLARRPRTVAGRGEIAEHVWDDRYDPLSNVIDVYVQRLRRKLSVAGAATEIRTRRGEGYELMPSTS